MSDIKTTVTFVDAVEVTDHNGDVEFSANAGEVMELPAASATRWIRRGKAVRGKVSLNDTKARELEGAAGEKVVQDDTKMEKQAPITEDAKAPAPKKKRAYTKKKTAPKKQAD